MVLHLLIVRIKLIFSFFLVNFLSRQSFGRNLLIGYSHAELLIFAHSGLSYNSLSLYLVNVCLSLSVMRFSLLMLLFLLQLKGQLVKKLPRLLMRFDAAKLHILYTVKSNFSNDALNFDIDYLTNL